VPALYSILDIAPIPRKDLAVTRLVTPLKVIEAMAMGKTVVVSDLPPLREIVGREEFGCSFPPGDPDALANALAKLCRDPALRARFGRAARARVESAYAWPENVAAFWKDVSTRLHLAAGLPGRGA
jgi:glycosyltransferase involved in cell wall biosynthesis